MTLIMACQAEPVLSSGQACLKARTTRTPDSPFHESAMLAFRGPDFVLAWIHAHGAGSCAVFSASARPGPGPRGPLGLAHHRRRNRGGGPAVDGGRACLRGWPVSTGQPDARAPDRGLPHRPAHPRRHPASGQGALLPEDLSVGPGDLEAGGDPLAPARPPRGGPLLGGRDAIPHG